MLALPLAINRFIRMLSFWIVQTSVFVPDDNAPKGA